MSTSNESQSKLEIATQRVQNALDLLEETVRARNADSKQSVHSEQHLQLVVDENNSLRSEQQQLNDAISLLQGQYDDLQKVAGNIYGKLDDSVRRISKIIGD